MKILFSNIIGGQRFAGDTYSQMEFAGEALQDYISIYTAYGASILSLTEVHFEDDSGKSAMVDALADQLALPHASVYHMHQSHIDPNKAMGSAILSKYPIKAQETFHMPAPPLEVTRPDGQQWTLHDKGAQCVTLDTPEGLIDIINLTYFPFHYFKRHMGEAVFAPHRQAVADFVTADRNPAIITADFNNKNMPLRTAFPELFAAGYAEAVITPTTVIGLADQQLDHILYDKRYFAASGPQVITAIPSDHYALATDVSRL
jgi:endonuclease/exonuclease/phosphatase family metal-dependent hydrolase